MSGPDVVVVGSINTDLVLRVPRLPAPGETVLAIDQSRFAGGKGANQAVAAARLGAAVAFVGCVGDDDAGRAMRANLQAAGVDAQHVRTTGAAPTGAAYISVDDRGENTIVVVAGANGELGAADVAAASEVIRTAPLVLAQLEIPDAAVAAVIETGATVLLNAAPARPMPRELLDRLDVLVVNESEAAILPAGLRGAVVVTHGARGASWRAGSAEGFAPAPSVDVVDTTGAGDAFVGALAAALSGGAALPSAVGRAVHVASRATTIAGAQLPADFG
ncbi:MAG TPA: ribokinase [Jatrophihabitans sp.]|jgi:ribokinase|nr:ribokinase [Jatrophihabitans sp.]